VATPDRLRRSERELTRLAANDLAALWRQITNAAEARIALMDVLPKLIDTYGVAASTVAAEWYDEARATAEVSGSFTAIPASIQDTGAEALAGWASDKGTDIGSILTLAEGGMQRRILNFSRQTVMGSSLADPRAAGWQRIGVGECTFCEMLIGRGAVYSEATVDFGAHDHCHCSAVPAFNGKPRLVKDYTPSARQSDADKARAKKWIAQNL
jgi:hypothetical protein